MKIAIIGNSEWQNRRKIQEILNKLRSDYDNPIIVGAGGKEGANMKSIIHHILAIIYILHYQKHIMEKTITFHNYYIECEY